MERNGARGRDRRVTRRRLRTQGVPAVLRRASNRLARAHPLWGAAPRRRVGRDIDVRQMTMPMKSRSVLLAGLAFPFCLSLAGAQGAQGNPARTEAVFVRAQQMVTAGQDVAGRAVIDSVLAATSDDTPRYAE